MSTTSKPDRPPTSLDAAERFLGWALIFGLVVLALTIGAGAWLYGRSSASVPPLSPTSTPASGTIALVIDFGDGSQRAYPVLPFTPGMSAADALRSASAHARGAPMEITGSGDTAFVTSVDGVRNQGAGDAARNWQYFVNTDFGRRGAGATMLSPGDRVTWVFALWQDNPALPAFPPIKP